MRFFPVSQFLISRSCRVYFFPGRWKWAGNPSACMACLPLCVQHQLWSPQAPWGVRWPFQTNLPSCDSGLSDLMQNGERAHLSSPPSSRLWNSISVHEENFSKMYAASPTGESFKPQPVKEEGNLPITDTQLQNSEKLPVIIQGM